MKKLLLTTYIVFVVPFLLFAKSNYSLSGGLFGNVGSMTINKYKKDKHYTIVMIIKTAGIVGSLTHHRTIKMVSKGLYTNRKYSSRYYSFENIDSKKRYIKEYKIDTKRKKVFKIDNHSKSHKLMKEFSTQDTLSVLFNLMEHPSLIKSAKYKVVGLENHKGYIQIVVPNPKQAQSEREKLGASTKSKIFYMLIPNKNKSPHKIVFAVKPKGGLESAYSVAIPVIGVIYIKHH